MSLDPLQVLRWYHDAGVDECIGDTAVDRFKATAPQPAKVEPLRPAVFTTPALSPAPAPGLSEAAAAPAALAHCATLAELRSAVEAYDGCALKTFASRTVFAQ